MKKTTSNVTSIASYFRRVGPSEIGEPSNENVTENSEPAVAVATVTGMANVVSDSNMASSSSNVNVSTESADADVTSEDEDEDGEIAAPATTTKKTMIQVLLWTAG